MSFGRLPLGRQLSISTARDAKANWAGCTMPEQTLLHRFFPKLCGQSNGSYGTVVVKAGCSLLFTVGVWIYSWQAQQFGHGGALRCALIS